MCVLVQVLEVKRQTMILWKGSEEALQFLFEDLTFAWILEDIANGWIEGVGASVDIVEVREDFCVFMCLLNRAFDLVVFVGVVSDSILEDGELETILGGSLQFQGRRIDVEPLG